MTNQDACPEQALITPAAKKRKGESRLQQRRGGKKRSVHEFQRGPPIASSSQKRSKTAESSDRRQLPCLFHIGEPERYRNDNKKYRFISELQRHLQSAHHYFFACEKCMTAFSNAEELEDHKVGADSCFKRCKKPGCKRYERRENENATAECSCIMTVEDQWRGLYALKYGAPPRSMFEHEARDSRENREESIEYVQSGRSSEDEVSNHQTIDEDSDAVSDVVGIASKASIQNKPRESSLNQEARALRRELADVYQRLDMEMKLRRDREKQLEHGEQRLKDFEDCLDVVWEQFRSVHQEKARLPRLQRWVERLLPQTSAADIPPSQKPFVLDNQFSRPALGISNSNGRRPSIPTTQPNRLGNLRLLESAQQTPRLRPVRREDDVLAPMSSSTPSSHHPTRRPARDVQAPFGTWPSPPTTTQPNRSRDMRSLGSVQQIQQFSSRMRDDGPFAQMSSSPILSRGAAETQSGPSWRLPTSSGPDSSDFDPQVFDQWWSTLDWPQGSGSLQEPFGIEPAVDNAPC